jgi:hypothetical protein
MKLPEQPESSHSCIFNWPDKPWKSGLRNSRKKMKQLYHRLERHRANQEPEVQPGYNRYFGYEY